MMTKGRGHNIFPAVVTAGCLLKMILQPVCAALYFDPSAIHLSGEQQQQINLAELIQPGAQVPGVYQVKVRVNQHEKFDRSIAFVNCGAKLCPMLDRQILQDAGVSLSAAPALAALRPGESFTDLTRYVPGAVATLDFSNMRLDLSLPQAMLAQQVRGDIPVQRWDDGIPALFVNYSASGAQSETAGVNTRSDYLNLRSGLNLGPWRLRNNGYYNHVQGENGSWTTVNTLLERDVRQWRSHLVLGQSSTPGLVFDSIGFQGAQLASDVAMLAESQQGFAPVIRGVALTNAQVMVRQKNILIYQTYVPAGPFTISDLYPTSASGDLQVEIHEENGSVRTFIQPFSAAPMMVRAGQFQYSLTAGQYRQATNTVHTAQFADAEWLYGWLNATTLYGGTIISPDYHSAALGIGQGLGILGALSFDATQAQSVFAHNLVRRGQSYQLRYNKSLAATDTNFTLAAYRFSTGGYYSFNDASEYWSTPQANWASAAKNRFQMTVSQSFGVAGSLSLNAYQQDYWSNQTTRTWSGSYNLNVGGIGLGLNYSNSQTSRDSTPDKVVSLDVTVPLSAFMHNGLSNSMVTYSQSRASDGQMTSRATLAGTLLKDNQLNYSLAQSASQAGQGESRAAGSQNTSGSLRYTGSAGVFNVGYSEYYGVSRRLNYGAQGAVVLHSHGVTLSQNLSEDGASALVQAPGAGDVKIKNQTGVYTDSRGYAVVPYLTGYRRNQLSLDTSTLAQDVDLSSPVVRVIPSKGAIVLADYQTHVGRRVYLTLTHVGKSLPFGAVVSSSDGVTGIADDNGQVWLTGVSSRSRIRAIWGDSAAQRCQADLILPPVNASDGITLMTLSCS
ncbi:fimbrial biogenesis outer membrane usher protein [Rahnella sp. AA]|uniref:fimbria/pilus outer membrane usher protein n=1 Tax=Rahnella sp. AA TaxID=2057180 RepID=UPI000C341615|nr:fimbria/pilus outer membrane usher protein [Rahnella sp. AA]PKE28838.1 fimbrial biogenesis outer membrane usher protein [Rahnella sp. AA]